MLNANFRITIKTMLGVDPRETSDAAAGPFILGTIRAVMDLRCDEAAVLTRKGLILTTVLEPTPAHIEALQKLGDDFARATGSTKETFRPRVEVETITSLPGAETSAVLLAAKLAFDVPGSTAKRQVPGGVVRVIFEPKNATASRELQPGDDVSDPTPQIDPADVRGMRFGKLGEG